MFFLLIGLSVGLEGLIRLPASRKASPSIKILLNGGRKKAFTDMKGRFSFDGLSPGRYSLEVSTPNWGFPSYIVHVMDNGSVQASFFDHKGVKRNLVAPLVLEPFGVPNYFEPRKQMNIMSMFMNPMGIMMIVMAVVAFGMPKLMGAMDPEEMKRMQEEMRKNQKDQPDPEKLMKGFFGGGAPESDSDEE